MRIVQVNYAFDPSAGEPEALVERYRTLRGWSEALVAAGATGVTVAQRFSRDAELARAGVRYIFRTDGGSAVAGDATDPAALHAAVAADQPDVVHVNGLMFPSQVRRLRAAVAHACAIVVQDHAGLLAGRGQWWDPRARRLAASLRDGLQAADAFLFAAAEQADAWRAAGVIGDRQRVFAVPESSTDLRPLPRGPAREVSGVDGDPAVLWVGRLDENKDPLTILDGFERLLRAEPGARLTMCFGGGGRVADVGRRLDRSPALASAVRLAGRVPADRMAAFYSAADLFVLGSHHEGSGYALIEALACGVTAVVTDIPPFRALAGAAPSAFWPPGDAAACAAALERAAGAMSEVTREVIRAHFERALSWDAIGRRATDVYRAVRERRRVGG